MIVASGWCFQRDGSPVRGEVDTHPLTGIFTCPLSIQLLVVFAKCDSLLLLTAILNN